VNSIHFVKEKSIYLLLQIIIFCFAITALVFWQWDLLNQFYFREQLTAVGIIINCSIMGLFIIGLLRIVILLFSFHSEEQTIIQFLDNIDHKKTDLLSQINPNCLLAHRYLTMKRLHEQMTPINHGALAATLTAHQSTRISLTKFIYNILILTGVFGTIISLSIALIGASDMLSSAVDVNGMGVVIHGMSTALSTTITAIVTYFFFGYFYLKMTDAQTNLISGIEQITNNHLIPLFQVQKETVLHEFSGMIRSLHQLIEQMHESQQSFTETQQQIAQSVSGYQQKMEQVDNHLENIESVLKQGFRL